jgi:hypothetical protein
MLQASVELLNEVLFYFDEHMNTACGYLELQRGFETAQP